MLNSKLKNILEIKAKTFYKKNQEKILDILLFGSIVKGKSKPNDIDLLLIFTNKVDYKVLQEFTKILTSNDLTIPIEVTGKTYLEIQKTSFRAREAVLGESYSLIQKNFLAQGFGYKPQVLFIYSLKGKTKSQRMRFYYSLHGRGKNEGMLEKLSSQKLTDTVLSCPSQSRDEMIEYLGSWQIEFTEIPILMSQRFT
ncbi:nucleotidyltransferase domain-containing protein [archaeon]|jgi:predicted nucleotidyltransferase|nr:nucleotidyltransferase domain-containing protein [archaeon]MBT6698401.1 nucleotidyltransferase domain-containing protein [archaeon]